jgi:ATP-dependent DNA helicase RecG
VPTVGHLLRRLPFRYEDRSHFSTIAALQPGHAAVVTGRVLDSRLIRTRRRGFTILEAAFDDGTGTLRAVWFNRPYLARALSTGRRGVLFGAAEIEKGRLVLQNPEYELFDQGEEHDPVHLGRIVGIYRRVGTVSGKWLRKVIFRALEDLEEDFDSAIGAPLVRRALREAHFPATSEAPEPARRLLAREELLVFCGALEERRERRRRESVPAWNCPPELVERLAALLPFRLTGPQQTALREIADDFGAGRPMARLLQGDVGTGKTAVALLAALLCAENGRQAALMAPTEILAEQHAEVIGRWLEGTRYRLALLTGHTREAARRPLRAALRSGEIDLLVGTHALVEKPVEFRDLGLAIIDEQHRFGVAHRGRLSRKGSRPHVLVLTATPIPRSLAWTLFGDLDVSRLDERPPGRGAVRTYLRGPEKRSRVYEFLRDRVRQGERAFVVVPAIEDAGESDREIAAAEKTAAELARALPEVRFGLLHGRLPAEKRQSVMKDFAAGTVDALVATTVVEVGIDVPQATVLVVENAERFGLAQLHQLRGRIGRGPRPSTCVLLASEGASEEARERLKFLAATQDGFKIAEKDLELRGPGELLGKRQAGAPDFAVADPIRDIGLLRAAREEARRRFARGETLRSALFPSPDPVIKAGA